jgi:hypothetical protein
MSVRRRVNVNAVVSVFKDLCRAYGACILYATYPELPLWATVFRVSGAVLRTHRTETTNYKTPNRVRQFPERRRRRIR